MNQDIKILRTLAYNYLEASLHEKNNYNRKLHTAVNDLKAIRPVVLIDEIPFHELNIDGSLTLHCTDPIFRGVEDYLRKMLFKWTHFPADMIIPSFIPVHKIVHSTDIGVHISEDILATDAANHIVAHSYKDQLATDEDLEKLTCPVITYDEVTTMKHFDYIANAIGDIIPVKLVGYSSYISIWDNIATYRGVTPLLMDLVERPEFTHKIVSKLTSFEISKSEQMEKLGLYEYGDLSLHCTTALTSDLPIPSDGENVQRKNIWGRGMAQIFSSVSKEMHDEFDIQYMKKIMEPFGLVYYGCCEPLDKKMDIVEKLPNLRKVSITPWADVNVAAEAIGKKYVLASKPNPASVATTLNEEALRHEITTILDACKRNNCNCDIVLKDISSVGYNLNNLIRWEQIVMELVNNY